jgi:predicted phage terminase large subunit-like protein
VTADEIAEAQSDLLTFTRTMFKARRGVDMLEAPFHHAICNALERVVIGKTKRLIINIPPRTGKTELAVKNFMAWAMGIAPDSEFIHASYAQTLATANAWETRAIMQHEAYAQIFGQPRFRTDSNAKDHFRTEQGGVVYATGAEGTITGFGAGKMRDTFGGAIIIDDPHKAGEGNSEARREGVLQWFQVTIESRKNTIDTPIVVIMQRLHELDLSGWLLSGGNGDEWEHVCIPALDHADASFWPAQFPESDLYRKRAANAYVFAGQYMQRPAPVGGGIFKDDWWQYRDVAPAIEYRTIYADTAMKAKEQNDYSVFQCWGKTATGQAVLLDMVRGKFEAPELLERARAFWAKHAAVHGQGHLRAFKIEDKASGTGLIQQLQREGKPVIGIPRLAGQDKVTRAYDAAPYIESGNVLLMRDCPHLSDLLAEASGFPNAAHDDTLDPLMDAVMDMLQPPAQASIQARRVGGLL